MMNEITLTPDSAAVQHLCRRDARLKKLISMVGPLTYIPGAMTGYAFLVHEIIEQMLSIKAAQKIYLRLEALCAGTVTPERVSALSREQIRSVGTSGAKAETIMAVTRAFSDGTLEDDRLAALPDAEVIRTLTKIRGIGTWTAKMYLIFILDRPDVLPTEDVAFLQVYKWLYKTEDVSRAAVEKRCRKWRPHSTAAVRYFYRALDCGLPRSEFHLYK